MAPGPTCRCAGPRGEGTVQGAGSPSPAGPRGPGGIQGGPRGMQQLPQAAGVHPLLPKWGCCRAPGGHRGQRRDAGRGNRTSGRAPAYPEPAPCVPEALAHLLGVALEPGPPGSEVHVGWWGGSAWWNLRLEGVPRAEKGPGTCFQAPPTLGAASARRPPSRPPGWPPGAPGSAPDRSLRARLRSGFGPMTQLFRAHICSLASLLKTSRGARYSCGSDPSCRPRPLRWLPGALGVKLGRVSLPAILMPSHSVGRKATGTNVFPSPPVSSPVKWGYDSASSWAGRGEAAR